jgi:hypothetical protein
MTRGQDNTTARAFAINDRLELRPTAALFAEFADNLPLAGGTMTGDLSLGDNVKAQFGAGNDLQIYHDGTHSYINDTGTGDLMIVASNNHHIKFANGDTAIHTVENAEVNLRYDNANKLATTSTGIDVTGEVKFGTGDTKIYSPVANNLAFETNSTEQMRITTSGRLGIGTSSPTQKLHVTGDVVIDKTNNGYSGLRIHDDSGGDYNSYIDLGRNQSGTRLTIRNSGRVQGTTPWTNATASPICSFARGGIAFGSDTASANTLNDYEEGTLNWKVQRTDQIAGTNDGTTRATYTKIGNKVFISGYIYTASTGTSSSGVYVRLLNTADNSAATLPFVPNHTGVLHVGHTRTMSPHEETSISFSKDSATVYVYQNDSTGDYIPNINNLPISNAQTHLVLSFQGVYTTDS